MPSILPPSATLWFFRTFGEDDRKITKKAQTSEPAAKVDVCDLIGRLKSATD
jgi:hypothetical protein